MLSHKINLLFFWVIAYLHCVPFLFFIGNERYDSDNVNFGYKNQQRNTCSSLLQLIQHLWLIAENLLTLNCIGQIH